MYAIYADGTCIYNDAFLTKSTKVVSPKLTLEDNTAGSLTMTVPPDNVGYDTITPLVTCIVVKKEGKEIWEGRVISEKKDFYNNRALVCEGELAYLNDTTQPQAEYTGSVRSYLTNLVNVHNSKVDVNHRFNIGGVVIPPAIDADFSDRPHYTNYEKTMELVNNLVETYGGHISVYKDIHGDRTIDYMVEDPDDPNPDTSVNRQIIRFGKNLLDFTRQWDLTEYATVILPLGARVGESVVGDLDDYLTVAEADGPDGQPYGDIYVYDQREPGATEPVPVERYGWLVKKITWNDIDNPNDLLKNAQLYLHSLQFDNMILDLSALDLHYLNVNYEDIKLLDNVQVISPPHGLNRLFPVTKLEIPLDSPEKTQFKLGGAVQNSLTSVNNQINSALMKQIDNLPKAQTLLDEAKANAAAIMSRSINGYITIKQVTSSSYTGSDAIIISNVPDWQQPLAEYWYWDMNGLAFWKRDAQGDPSEIRVAIDEYGRIVANAITAGTLNADLIRAGVLRAYNNNNNYWNMLTGEFRLKSSNSQTAGIEVDANGYLTINANYITAGILSSVDGDIEFNLNTGSLVIYDDRTSPLADVAFEFVPPNHQTGTAGHLYVGTSATFAGELVAARGTFAGSLQAASGTFAGSLQAASGRFTGVVQASDFLDAAGNSMLEEIDNVKKFKSDYLDLGNIKLDGTTGRVKIISSDAYDDPIMDALSFVFAQNTPVFRIGFDNSGNMVFNSAAGASVTMQIAAPLHLDNRLILNHVDNYGSALPTADPSRPFREGQIFFVLD